MAPRLRDLILKPSQSSWTNPNGVNFQKVFTTKTDSPDSYARTAKIADMVLANILEDLSKNADHCLNMELTKRIPGGTLPNCVDLSMVTAVMGAYTFLNLQANIISLWSTR